ncbi:nuclear transport factor 2 family protein [Streptomyces capparidis]
MVDALQERLLAHDMAGFADLWAPDGVMEFPFAPPGWAAPSCREEVRAHLRDYTDHVDIRAIRHEKRHETGDPDTLILEWGVDGVALGTGRRYLIDYVAVITVGAEGVTRYRDYWNPLAAGHVLGNLDAMVEAVTGGTEAAA